MTRCRRTTRPDLLRATLAALLLLLLAAPPLLGAGGEEGADQFFDSDGVRIRYRVWGTGEPIVLVHGFTASVEANWVTPGVVAALAPHFRVIALDNRGHGKSDKPHEPAAYGDDMGDDVIRLLDHLGIEKAHFVGYSMGGFIGLDLATRHPERLLSVTLGGAGWLPPSDAPIVPGLAESLESGQGIMPLLDALHPPGQPAPPPEQIAAMNQMIMAMNDPLALAAVIRGMKELQIPEADVRKIEVPIQAVIGEIDPLRSGVEALDTVLPPLDVVVLPGKDHVTAMSDPALAQAVHDFVIGLCKCA